ncbi:MAG: hypothetical protein GX928_02210 [Ruminococcaceae bacterium]|nr:hypothetical protein [Oscillospiraceae bacterium]
MEKSFQKKRVFSNPGICFLLFFITYTISTFYLFYRQSVALPGENYLSDMPFYIMGAFGENLRDPYPYKLFFWCIRLFSYIFSKEISAAVATTLFNSLNVFVLYHFAKKLIQKDLQSDLKNTFMIFSWLIASMVIIPYFNIYKFPGQFYIGQGTGNMWHNATYLATRPFSTASFFLFIEILDDFDHKRVVHNKKLVLFSISLFLSVFAKPTFAIVFFPAVLAIIVVKFVKGSINSFSNLLKVLICFLPAGLDMIRQFFPVFVRGEGSGIGFGFADVWRLYSDNIFLSITLCFAFPMFIYLLNFRSLIKNNLLLTSLILTLISLAEGIFIYEKGPRMPDGNFLQGYQHAMFYSFICTSIFFVNKKSHRMSKTYSIMGAIIFFAHVVSGCYYFIRILSGMKFY